MPRRKHKPKKISLPGGQAIEQRSDRPGRPPGRIAEPADKIALDARMRIAGHNDKARARLAMNESDMGRCILAIHPKPENYARLWDVWRTMENAIELHEERNIGLSRFAQGASLPLLPEPMQTDQSHSVDLRTPEEKNAAARRNAEYWRGLIDQLPAPQMKWAMQPALDAVKDVLWLNAAPTDRGRNAVAALVWIAKAHEK